MKQTDNPFEGLGIRYPQARFSDGSVKQKAFFEHGSYEAGLIPFEDRITILTEFVLAGFDMHRLVDNYLEEKDALDDDRRKSHIASTFFVYSTRLSMNFLDKIEEKEIDKQQVDCNLKRLIRQFYGNDRYRKSETFSKEMHRRINEFVTFVKEIHSNLNNNLLTIKNLQQ
jgi:hypothetical protein